jgi:hypothetical protein
MTLTLTETIDAIRAIDTDTDIILGACKQIAGLSRIDCTDELAITRDIFKRYLVNGTSPRPVITALTTCLGALTAKTAHIGNELTAWNKVLDAGHAAFMDALTSRIREETVGDDEAMVKRLLNIMSQSKQVEAEIDEKLRNRS